MNKAGPPYQRLTWVVRLLGTVDPAWVNVSATASPATADPFGYETLQLTTERLAELSASASFNLSLFEFESNSSSQVTKRSASGSCKTAPGDWLWPSAFVWEIFDLLLGGALVKTVPLASPCYHNWGNYDADLCSLVTANWSTWSYMQCVSSHFSSTSENDR